ncbi:MAG TPA: hypothetical protein VGO58_06855 [Chitinophagaceae bacterium]|jgi:hypothetical protein|nr:hypothetical protein [Chitinophagaceae bacterium]
MNTHIKTIRSLLKFFIVALALSGLTAIPAEQELDFLCRVFPTGTRIGDWLDTVYRGFHDTNTRYPFLAYGYDWLAFAHVVLAILFYGPLKDPVKNKWVIEFGIIACLLIIPWAMITGHFRHIPFWWRLIDCSFGVVGLLLLSVCLKKINRLEEEQKHELSLNTID